MTTVNRKIFCSFCHIYSIKRRPYPVITMVKLTILMTAYNLNTITLVKTIKCNCLNASFHVLQKLFFKSLTILTKMLLNHTKMLNNITSHKIFIFLSLSTETIFH